MNCILPLACGTFLIVIGALLLLPWLGAQMGMNLNPLGDLLRAVVGMLASVVLTMAGWT